MKKIITFSFFILAISYSAFAQSRIPEFEKARQIKLLESTRADVKKILKGYEYDKSGDENLTQTFSTKNADVEVTFSSGDCSDDADDTDSWNVPKGKVTRIEISPNDPVKLKNFKFDISDFRKEQKFFKDEDLYVYHNKNLGIALEVNEGEIETIYLFPTRSYYASLCENEEAEELKEFYSTESFFGNSKLEDRTVISCAPAGVTNLALSTSELTICPDGANNKKCLNNKMEISVATEATDPEDDVLTYHYNISGGKIIGEGAKVVWDLWDAPAGTHTITAGVDDGCGICGPTVTKTVVVKECPDCQ